MKHAISVVWRRYRDLPGRAQALIAVGAILVVIIAAAVGGGSGQGPVSHVASTGGSSPAGSLPTTSSSESSLLTTTTVSTAPASSATTVAPATTSPTASPTGASAGCHVSGSGLYVLPDPACTPGATNPAVTQANIGSTICVAGWTATVRPPESYTEPIKIQQMTAYGDTGSTGGYEEDHLIPLELGGSPTDPRNLWPEPGGAPNPKDSVENAAKRAVCDGQMALAVAQQAIATNWIALARQLGAGQGSTPTSAVTTAPTVATPPTTAAATGCHPLSSAGNCYKRGQLCPSADHGMTGTDANGNTITCEDNDGWRWE